MDSRVQINAAAVLLFSFGAVTCVPVATAHHSFASAFDASREVDREGVVREVRWHNPHVSFDLEVVGGSEEGQVYVVETESVSALRARDIEDPFVAVGDRIRIIGNPARRRSNRLHLRNILLASGDEIVLQGDAEPRFAESQVGTTGPGTATEGDGSRPELGIFRVWSTVGSFPFPEDLGEPELAHTLYPLTGAARAALEAFDPVADNPLADCAPKGMPTIMEQPYPMEFVRTDDGDILLQLEEYDTRRHIHMDSSEEPSNHPPSLLGFSQGSWDDDTLVVQTSRISWPHFDTVGIPLGPNAVIVERFTPAEDGSRLDLSMTVISPDTFTSPVKVEKYYLYVPDVEVEPYECTR